MVVMEITKKRLRLPKLPRALLFALMFAVIGTSFIIYSSAASNSTISGTLFDDANRNGVVDSGEVPFASKGIAVYRQQDSSWVAGAVTDANGKFTFSGLEDGNYYVATIRSVWVELRGDYVPSFTSSSTDFELPVSLTGATNVNFGLRKIVRSRVIEQPISTVTTPKGMIVRSYNDAVTAQQVLDALNKGTLRGEEEKTTKIYFDYNSIAFCSSSYAGAPGSFSAFSASCWINWLGWVDTGDQVLFHEYGHAWSNYYDHIVQQDGTFNKYLAARGLSGDSRIGTNGYWDPREMIAEDYRQLFGSENARTYTQANKDIPPAKDVPGLEDFLRNTYTKSPAAGLGAPTNLTGSATSTAEGPAVNLSWTASTGSVYRYEIYRNGVKIGFVNSPTTTYYDGSNLTNSTSYNYYVKAVDSAGTSSAASNTITFTTPAVDIQKPTAPSNLISTAQTKNSISLQWMAGNDNVMISEYRIYQDARKHQSILKGTALGTTFTVSGLKARTSYTFYITAVDSSGNESLPSNTLTIKTR